MPTGLRAPSNSYAEQRIFRPERPCHAPHSRRPSETTMLDVVVLAIGIGFFAASILYVTACDRL